MNKCANCNTETNNKKFCGLSCSVKYNNTQRTKKTYGDCLHCGKELKRKNQKFCSQSCSGSYNNRRREKKIYNNCLNCNHPLNSKDKKFCNNSCQQHHQRKVKIDKWLNEGVVPGTLVIKQYVLEKSNYCCTTCGISKWNNKPIVLDLDHIDGNSENNDIENLTVICPNCHSQTPTFKGKNRGNGRHSRKLRYDKGLSY